MNDFQLFGSKISLHSKNIQVMKKYCVDNNLDIEKFYQWCSSTPSYTTFRVNTCKVNIEHVIDFIKEQLRKQASVHNCSLIPDVFQDEILNDCIVISNWPTTDGWVLGDQGHEVIVDVLCGTSLLRGAHVYAPGVLAISPGAQVDEVVAVYADVSAKCLRGYMKRYDDPLRTLVGYGRVKMNRKTLFEGDKHQSGVAVEMVKTTSGVPVLVFPADFGLLQNYPSILCSHVLDPSETDLVLDMCASPGNKTTHIAALIKAKGGGGAVMAMDKTKSKVLRIDRNCENQQLDNVKAYAYDARKAVACRDADGDGHAIGPPPFLQATFHRILLDAPCSALGQRPQLSPAAAAAAHQNLNSYPVIQRKLLTTAVQLLNVDGVLVYSTCTLSTEENEKMVAWALQQFPCLSLVAAVPIVGSPGTPNCGLSREQCQMVQRFGPNHSHNVTPVSHHTDTIGFFIAKLKKCAIR